MIKYPKTGHFRNVIKQVKKDFKNNPILTFEVSIKAHGTNGGIVFNKDGSVQYQSRNKVLSLDEDNLGFMRAMSNKNIGFIEQRYLFDESVIVYGEWCGKGVQNGVALSQLKDKIFIIFQVIVDGVSTPFKSLRDHSQGIYNIYDFGVERMHIDFSNPIASQNYLVKMTENIESVCPIGKFFGLSGIGEGIVVRSVQRPDIVFKVKGEKHATSAVKTLASVDPEKLKSVEEFITYAVTENRLNQGLENVELDLKNTGKFIKWVIDDIIAEESDVLQNSQLIIKDVQKQISLKSVDFFKNKLNN